MSSEGATNAPGFTTTECAATLAVVARSLQGGFAMNQRTWLVCGVVGGLLLAVQGLAFADPPSSNPGRGGPPPEVVAMLLERGWQQVTPEIFQRPVEENVSYETIAFGADGLSWLLRVMEAKLQSLEALRKDEYSPDLEEAIAAHQALMQRTRDTMEEAFKAPGEKRVDTRADWSKAACDTSVHRLASASPGTVGPAATGEASFTETCGDYGATTVITYAEGFDGSTFNTRSRTCSPTYNPDAAGYGSGSCAATIDDLVATSLCTSSTTANVQIDYGSDPVVWHLQELNPSYCILLSAVAVTGTSSLYVPPYSCKSASWSATATGGTLPLEYSWLYDGVQVGTNSASYARTYCNNGCNPPCYDQVFNDTVSVVVGDAAGDEVSDSHGVTITLGGRCNSTAVAKQLFDGAGKSAELPQCPAPTVCNCQIPNQQ